jgi:transcriptional regulator with XRE-family HTH domain
MIDNIKVGTQLLLLRKRNGLTQEELAEKLEISAQAISK